jgi:aminobenzoyl-glutamate transport protein
METKESVSAEEQDGRQAMDVMHPPEEDQGWFSRFLVFVEWLGNLLPHPVTLFALFAMGVIVVSGLAEWLGWAVQDPRPEGAAGRSPDGIRSIKKISCATD